MSGEDSSAHTGPMIGRTLELARKERGLSLKQVEQATKIRARYLEELERENFDVLPPVYVQGSLKTYANFLQLDGEALVRELKRRREPRHEPQDPATVELPKGDYFDRSLIFLGGATGAESQEKTEDEEGAGAASILKGGNLIYLGSAAFLVLVLIAVALALTIPGESQPAVSQMHEPLISQAPSQMSHVGGEEKERAQPQEDDEQSTEDENDNRQPEQQTGSEEDGGGSVPAGQDQGGDQLAQAPRDATATPSASPPSQKEPADAEPDGAATPPATGAPVGAPDQGRVAGAPANQSGGVPPPNVRGTREPRSTSRGPRGSGDFQVQVVPGADDPVRITGSPVGDR
jgi:hypothetical protein